MFLCVRQSVKFPSITCTCSMLVYPGRDVCAFVPEGGVPVKKSYRLRYHIIYPLPPPSVFKDGNRR